MSRNRPLVLALGLLLALSACNNDNIDRSSVGITRFQMVISVTDSYLLDGATGDLWKLDEPPGEDAGHWIHFADGPNDAKPITLESLLRPKTAAAAPAEEEQPEDEPKGKKPEQEGYR